MKLQCLQPWRGCCSYKVLRALFYSTKVSTSSQTPMDSLYRRISQSGDPRISIVRVLDQWVEEGREVKQSELQKLIKQLRKYRRFRHALQLSEWMNNEMNQDPSPGDIAIRLHLISKVYGLEQAEKYFSSIVESSRDYRIYGALLNCYVENKNLEKAEKIMQKMREIGFMKTSLPYNVMLNLYAHFGQHEKLDLLMQEMEEKGISHDRFTYNIRMNAYAATSNTTNMEKLLSKMEADPLISMDWHAYYVAANGYLKAGLFDKSRMMLKRSEQLVGDKQKWFAYECLLTLYTALGSKDEVYRIWKLYTNMKRRYNSGYLCMISSLMKLDDIDAAERILKEWESAGTCFDYRIPNMMITIYCKKGLVDRAEAYISRLIERGNEPRASTWDRLATGYHTNGQMTKAVETVKMAVLASQPGWKPNYYTLAACFEFLKTNGKIEEAEEMIRLIRKQGLFSDGICEGLEDFIHSENSTASAVDQLRQDDQIERDDPASNGNKDDMIELEYEETSK